MLLEENVDAACVSLHESTGILIHGCEIAVSGAGEAEGAELLVGFQGERTDDFGELAARGTSHEIELPKAILSHDVALGFDGVGEGCGANVGNAPVIALDSDFFLEAGKGNGTIELG